MEIEIGKMLKDKGFTISCAESCTGGLLTNRLTDVPGCSDYLKGSIIAYANEIKTNTLKVKESMINEFGAVSEPVALSMAIHVREILNTTIGIGITGIAGPTGGTEDKPVGLVYVAVSGPNGDMIKKFNFNGNRTEIKEKVVDAALVLIQVYLTLEKGF